jgi:cation transport regulator ChaC
VSTNIRAMGLGERTLRADRYERRKNDCKQERRAVRYVLERTTSAYRLSATASVIALLLAVAVCVLGLAFAAALTFAGTATAWHWLNDPATFCAVEASLGTVLAALAYVFHRRTVRLQTRLDHATRALARARARLADLRAVDRRSS